MMDEEIRQALTEVREMKKMCGNINMKLTNIVTQRGQDIQKKLDAEYQRGLEEGKAQSERGCEGCKYAGSPQGSSPCFNCSNYYQNNWTAKQTDDKSIDIIRNGIHNWVVELNVKLDDIASILEEMRK